MPKTIVSAWNGVVNVGSEAILKVLLDFLKKYHHPKDIDVVSWNPGHTERKYGVRATYEFSFLRQLKDMALSKNYIVGGGDLLGDLGDGLTFWATRSMVAKILKNNLSIYSVGVRPVESTTGKKITKKLVEACETVSVRDKQSLDRLKGLDPEGKIKLVSDPAFLLESSSQGELDRIYTKYGISHEKEKIGISLRHWLKLHGVYSAFQVYDPEVLIKKVSMVLDDFAERGKQIIYLPMQLAPYANDKEVGERLEMAMENDLIVVDELLDPGAMKTLIGDMDCLISMRMHGLIFGLSERVPCLGLSYAYTPRVRGLMEEFDLEDYIVNILDVSSEELKYKVNNCLNMEDKRIKRLNPKVRKHKSRARKGLELLRNGLRC